MTEQQFTFEELSDLYDAADEAIAAIDSDPCKDWPSNAERWKGKRERWSALRKLLGQYMEAASGTQQETA